MESTMNDLDVKKPLPPVIAINSAQNHLYSIELSLFSFGSQTRKDFIIYSSLHLLFLSKYSIL